MLRLTSTSPFVAVQRAIRVNADGKLVRLHFIDVEPNGLQAALHTANHVVVLLLAEQAVVVRLLQVGHATGALAVHHLGVDAAEVPPDGVVIIVGVQDGFARVFRCHEVCVGGETPQVAPVRDAAGTVTGAIDRPWINGADSSLAQLLGDGNFLERAVVAVLADGPAPRQERIDARRSVHP